MAHVSTPPLRARSYGTCNDDRPKLSHGSPESESLLSRTEHVVDHTAAGGRGRRPRTYKKMLTSGPFSFCTAIAFLAFAIFLLYAILSDRAWTFVMARFSLTMRLIAQLILSFFVSSSNAVTFTPLNPPSFPLAVRNPYLSAWIPGSLVSNLPSSNPQFWDGNDLHWTVIARVDNTTYNLFGVSSAASNTQSATVTSAEYTSTHSIFKLTAGDAVVTLDFFSPVSFDDYLRESLPFSYLTVSVTGSGSAVPTVQLYSDIDDTWTGQSSRTGWSFETTGNTSVFQLEAEGRATYSQNSYGMALWGQAVYASRPTNGSTLTSASGASSTLIGNFVNSGSLTNTYSAWSSGAVTAFSHNLGSVDGTSSVQFAIGYVRIDAINYLGSSQTHYYRATYPETLSAVSHFLDDYDDAYSESVDLDSTIDDAGAIVSSNYSDVLALSLRQIFGGIDVTIPNDTLSTDDAFAFIKEISSDGNVNTVDVIFPTFPIFYLFNAEYIRLFLEPVIRYLTSGRYSEPYVIHDIGTNYPNATGHDNLNEEKMPIEETGNLLILALAYQKATGNSSFISSYADLFKGYADYLVENGQYPAKQLSTNDAIGSKANQTNLGIKAAVALVAYGTLTSSSNYSETGRSFAYEIYDKHLGTSSDGSYFTITYGSTSWFQVFNLYPDLLFSLDTFNESAYDVLSVFYPTVHDSAGVPLDGDVAWGKTDWQMWTAAYLSDDSRDLFINDLWAYISNGLNTAPLSDRYWTRNTSSKKAGQYRDFRARPTLGAHFASVAIKKGANGLARRRKRAAQSWIA